MFLLAIFFSVILIQTTRAFMASPCYPPMKDGSSSCVWNCGVGTVCSGILFCGPKSTSCTVNCMGTGTCSEYLMVISQSAAHTQVNCHLSRSTCKKLLLNCGDFSNAVLSNLGERGMFRFSKFLLKYNEFARVKSANFYRQGDSYSKCSLNCGGNGGDSCVEASMSCAGKFSDGCRVNVIPPTSLAAQGDAFKAGHFLCGLRNAPADSGSCLMDCQAKGRSQAPCISSRFGCTSNFVISGTPKPGICYCNGPVCSSGNINLVSQVSFAIPPPPTRKPTPRPTRRPTNKPTRRPTKRPTPKPTLRPTRKPTNKPTNKPTQKPIRATTTKKTTTLTTRLIAFPSRLKIVGRVFEFFGSLTINNAQDRKKFGGNTLRCLFSECVVLCSGIKSCENLILQIGAASNSFKLLCNGERSCDGLEVFSDAVNNVIECTGKMACYRGRFNIDAPSSKGGLVHAGQSLNLICAEGACIGRQTTVNCGFNVQKCKIQSSGVINSFGGELSCFSTKQTNKCELMCHGKSQGLVCEGARFKCVEPARCKCYELQQDDCPIISKRSAEVVL